MIILIGPPLGPALPTIPEWTREHFEFSGYVAGFEPGEITDRAALRAELGYAPEERICVVASGGSGVGLHLLERAVAAFPEASERVPGLRMVVVAGPRLDPALLNGSGEVEVRGYVHRLYRELAATLPTEWRDSW